MARGVVDRVRKFCIKMFLALYYILKEAQAHLSRQKKIIPSMYVTIAAVREDFFLQPSCFCARHMNDPNLGSMSHCTQGCHEIQNALLALLTYSEITSA